MGVKWNKRLACEEHIERIKAKVVSARNEPHGDDVEYLCDAIDSIAYVLGALVAVAEKLEGR